MHTREPSCGAAEPGDVEGRTGRSGTLTRLAGIAPPPDRSVAPSGVPILPCARKRVSLLAGRAAPLCPKGVARRGRGTDLRLPTPPGNKRTGPVRKQTRRRPEDRPPPRGRLNAEDPAPIGDGIFFCGAKEN
ncbi:hypothetical protein GCM10010327_12740 [Streptomyces nitrosporeus]|nr:hypothetical protein GCM10010327_12740 [Streptomyces nitrosporeus]